METDDLHAGISVYEIESTEPRELTVEHPRITVVTQNFQDARFLEATMRSVLDQGYPNLEYFVIDGESTDGSVEIIQRHADRLDWWCSEPDEGISHAVNKGFARATGDVLGWLGSSDLLAPGSLHRIGRAFRDPSTRVVCGWNVTIDEQNRILGMNVFPQPTADVLRHRWILPQESVYWRTDVYKELGALDESLQMRMDLDYWLRMAQMDIVPTLIPSIQGAYREHEGMVSLSDPSRMLEEWNLVFGRVHGRQIGKNEMKRGVPLSWRLHYKLMKIARRFGWPNTAEIETLLNGLPNSMAVSATAPPS